MAEDSEERLRQHFDRMHDRLPDRLSRLLHWLRRPQSRWVRIPLGLLLIAAGFFSFLPILGLWMLPLGLLLLAQDLPFLRGPMNRLLDWAEARWARWKQRPRP